MLEGDAENRKSIMGIYDMVYSEHVIEVTNE